MEVAEEEGQEGETEAEVAEGVQEKEAEQAGEAQAEAEEEAEAAGGRHLPQRMAMAVTGPTVLRGSLVAAPLGLHHVRAQTLPVTIIAPARIKDMHLELELDLTVDLALSTC